MELPLLKFIGMLRVCFFCFMGLSVLLACQSSSDNSGDHSAHSAMEAPKTPADSLYGQVMEMHDLVMPKMGKVRGAQKRAQALLDSIGSLPTRSAATLTPYKKELETLVSELNYADYAMDQWMMEFNLDSGKNNIEIRLAYLRAEFDKVSKVKDAVLNSLAKADTLLKK
ncbi:MAG: hypothetical protein RLZZ466_1093 [Bacteroidota bacterium]|jgi:hypothetical protein